MQKIFQQKFAYFAQSGERPAAVFYPKAGYYDALLCQAPIKGRGRYCGFLYGNADISAISPPLDRGLIKASVFVFNFGVEHRRTRSVARTVPHAQRCYASCTKISKSLPTGLTKLCRLFKNTLTNLHFVVQYKVGKISVIPVSNQKA